MVSFLFLFTARLPASLASPKAIGRVEPGQWIFQQGQLTWRAAQLP